MLLRLSVTTLIPLKRNQNLWHAVDRRYLRVTKGLEGQTLAAPELRPLMLAVFAEGNPCGVTRACAPASLPGLSVSSPAPSLRCTSRSPPLPNI